MNRLVIEHAGTARYVLLLSLVFVLAATVLRWSKLPEIPTSCLTIEQKVVICAASNMARYHRAERIELEHPDFDLRNKTLVLFSDGNSDSEELKQQLLPVIRLQAARNESIGFQLIFKATGTAAPMNVQLKPGDWQLNDRTSGKTTIRQTNQTSTIQTSLFLAHYHRVDNASYSWGPKSNVREFPADYPDALIPEQHGCLGESSTLFKSIALPRKKNHNQSMWIDSFIHSDTSPGVYHLLIDIMFEEHVETIVLELDIVDALLPEKPSIDAIGEVYRSYSLEGAGTDRSLPDWKNMAQCYQQLAHQHRLVFIERTPELLDSEGWSEYVKAYDAALTGRLFSDDYGYTGTGVNTPVSVWRTPWPQEFNVTLDAPLHSEDFLRYSDMAHKWRDISRKHGWNSTSFFAYVFDEVDGPAKNTTDADARRHYLSMVHDQMGLLQDALDSGTTDETLDLLWTSHSNPATWANDIDLDLTGKVRLWSPNASAADPEFLGKRISAGDTAWFYHSGHPAVGAHSINAYGVDMRTWGVIGARYGFQGQFMWAVNLGSDDKPFAEPSYKPDDDRIGNGVLVYPGNQLDKIGFARTPGPLPSMRLKSWRRGLQDAELYFLAKQKDADTADRLLHDIMPVALADARGKASWSFDAADWIEFRKKLLALASGPST